MKKLVLTVLGTITFGLFSFASNYMRVEKVDGIIDDYDVEEVKEVTFNDDATVMIVNLNSGNTIRYDIDNIARVSVDSSIYGDYEFVDLGLSVKWATCNLGAKNKNEHGSYFAWGEVAPKKSYSNLNYEWCIGNYLDFNLTKYCSSSCSGYNGYIDYLSTLLPEDDAATVNWGGYWRTPSGSEWEELIYNCVWTWDGNGYVVTGSNGNSIFIPANNAYWSSNSKCEDGESYNITKQFVNKTYDLRYTGNLIRPVIGSYKRLPVHTVSFFRKDSTLIKSFRVTHGNSINANSVTAPNVKGYFFSGWDYESFDNITSDVNAYPVYEEFQTPEAIDLGLSVKWASANLGASTPEEAGLNFAWGRIYPEPEGSDRSDYEIVSGTTYGYSYEDPETLLPIDDAATNSIGSDWHIPTYEEWKELIKECEWSSVREKGKVYGYKVTGKNGNSIYLPSSDYWTSDIYPMSHGERASKAIVKSSVEMYYNGCYQGLSVRPVYSK